VSAIAKQEARRLVAAQEAQSQWEPVINSAVRLTLEEARLRSKWVMDSNKQKKAKAQYLIYRMMEE